MTDILKTSLQQALKDSESRWTVALRNLSGPAISTLLIAVIALLSFGTRVGLWTESSEITRAQSIGFIGMVLAGLLGVVLWVLVVGKPTRLEISAGPVSGSIETPAEDEAK